MMDFFHELNWLDWLFINVVVVFAIIGYWKGFAKSILSLGVWITGFLVAYFFMPTFQVQFVRHLISHPVISFWVSIIVLTIIVWVLCKLVLMVCGVFVDDGFSLVNKVAGGFLGMIKAYVFLSFIIWILMSTTNLSQYQIWQESRLVPYLNISRVWHWLTHNSPASDMFDWEKVQMPDPNAIGPVDEKDT